MPEPTTAEPRGPSSPVDDTIAEGAPDTPRVESPTEAKSIIEALLFTTNQAMSGRRLAGMLAGWTEGQVTELVMELRDELDDAGRGVMLQEVAGGWLMCTRPRHADWVYSLHRSKRRNPLTPQALETLAIIAYKQPITRADVEVIRGVDAGGMLRNLLDLDLVQVVGHRETLGRPPLYGTTDLFLRTFGLRSLSDLPSIDELKALLPKSKAPETAQAEDTGATEDTETTVDAEEAEVEEFEGYDDIDDPLAEPEEEFDGGDDDEVDDDEEDGNERL